MKDLEWATFCALRFNAFVDFAAICDNWPAKEDAIVSVVKSWESRTSRRGNAAASISRLFSFSSARSNPASARLQGRASWPKRSRAALTKSKHSSSSGKIVGNTRRGPDILAVLWIT